MSAAVQEPCSICGAPGTRFYLCGWRCLLHTPARSRGHAEPPVPPKYTLDDLLAEKRARKDPSR